MFGTAPPTLASSEPTSASVARPSCPRRSTRERRVRIAGRDLRVARLRRREGDRRDPMAEERALLACCERDPRSTSCVEYGRQRGRNPHCSCDSRRSRADERASGRRGAVPRDRDPWAPAARPARRERRPRPHCQRMATFARTAPRRRRRRPRRRSRRARASAAVADLDRRPEARIRARARAERPSPTRCRQTAGQRPRCRDEQRERWPLRLDPVRR